MVELFKAKELWFRWGRRDAGPSHLKTGRWGERLAVKLLKKNGYRICGKRVRVGRHDELDIIAQKDLVLIFVEVKTRKNIRYGRPISAVNQAKKRRISRAAITYLKQSKLKPDFIRFDVIEVIGSPSQPNPEIRHVENAFALVGRYKLWW